MDIYVAVVLNKAEFAELIEKETHTRARSANYVGERSLANFGNDRIMFPSLPKWANNNRILASRFSVTIEKQILLYITDNPRDRRR